MRQMLGDVPVVAIRTNGTVHVLADRCSHMSGPLSGGELADACLNLPMARQRVPYRRRISGPRARDRAAARLRGPRGWRRDPGLPAGRRVTAHPPGCAGYRRLVIPEGFDQLSPSHRGAALDAVSLARRKRSGLAQSS